MYRACLIAQFVNSKNWEWKGPINGYGLIKGYPILLSKSIYLDNKEYIMDLAHEEDEPWMVRLTISLSDFFKEIEDIETIKLAFKKFIDEAFKDAKISKSAAGEITYFNQQEA